MSRLRVIILTLGQRAGGMRKGMCKAAVLYHPQSGRKLKLHTNAPGLQVYTGNFLEGVPGKDAVTYVKQQSICLESQTYPNAVNTPAFPSPLVQPSTTYVHRMTYELTVQ